MDGGMAVAELALGEGVAAEPLADWGVRLMAVE
jgi:hypothetical protein